jgi:hypothetical protein
MVMLVMCESESATLSSGNRPRSRATIESCTIGRRASGRATRRGPRVLVTTTSLSSRSGCFVAVPLPVAARVPVANHGDDANDVTHGLSPKTVVLGIP